MSGEGEIVGMVDVLKLTYATLDQVDSLLKDLSTVSSNKITGQHHVYWRQRRTSMEQILDVF